MSKSKETSSPISPPNMPEMRQEMQQATAPDLTIPPHQNTVNVPPHAPTHDNVPARRAIEEDDTMPPVKLERSIALRRDMPLMQCPTNIDRTSFAGRAMLLAAGNPSDIQFDENGRATILATHYLIFRDEGVDPETGEVSEFARTVFFDRTGQTYRTTSAHAARRVSAMLELFTPDEWARGIPLQILERKSRKTGRTYHDMRIDPMAAK